MTNKTDSRATVLLLHEIYGITENLRYLAALLEQQGYRVLLPSFYPENHFFADEQQAYAYFLQHVDIETASVDLQHIISRLSPAPVILIGFSIGATLAWLQAQNPHIQGVVAIYGSRIRHYTCLTPSVPCRLFFCHEKHFDVQHTMQLLAQSPLTQCSWIHGEHGLYSHDAWHSHDINAINQQIISALDELMAVIPQGHDKPVGETALPPQ